VSLFFTGPLTPLGVVGSSVGYDDTVECSDIPCMLIAPFLAATLSPRHFWQGLRLCLSSYGGRDDAFTLVSLSFTGPLTPLGVVGPSVGYVDTVECSDIPCMLIAPFLAATLSLANLGRGSGSVWPPMEADMMHISLSLPVLDTSYRWVLVLSAGNDDIVILQRYHPLSYSGGANTPPRGR
jgi:hypothetical protein